MRKADIYKLLEDKMLRYADLVSVPDCPLDKWGRTVSEPMVKLRQGRGVKTRQIDEHMLKVTGKDIYVRESVADKLLKAIVQLQEIKEKYTLEVVYGYRSLKIQTGLFKKYKEKLSNVYSGDKLLEAVHRLVAVPEVSGHPTGGAVDVQIISNGKPLDFGTEIWEFVPDAYTFSPFISRQAWNNRQLLRRLMLDVGFAPFDGEWWHYSYGDKEWAKFYGKPKAQFEQVNFWATASKRNSGCRY